MATALSWTSHATKIHPFNFGLPHSCSEKPQNCQCNQIQMSSLALPSHDQLERFCNLGQLDGELDTMLNADNLAALPSVDVCISLIKTCNEKNQAKRVHTYLALLGLEKVDSLSESLLVAYTKFTGLEDSLQLFQGLPHQSVVSWTAILSSCVDSRKYQKALNLYYHMQEEGVDPNSYTFVTLLKACSRLHSLDVVKELHADIKKQGFGFDIFIGSTLMSIYGKCGRTIEAENVFAALPERDLVSWNAMLLAYVEQGEGDKALLLFRQLYEEGVRLNERSVVIGLQACCILEEREGSPMRNKVMSEIGRSLHADALRQGFSSNAFVSSTLMILYSKIGSIAEAENVFSRLLKPDTVLWNAMLLAYLQQGQAEKCLQLYLKMLAEGFYPSERTFVILFQACCMLAGNEEAVLVEEHWTKIMSLEIGRSLHEDACRKDFDENIYIRSILVEMYGTTGSIVEAETVFFKHLECDSVLLNAMLSEYVECGRADDALGLYKETVNHSTNIDEQTFIAALRALCILAKEEEPVMGGQGRKTWSLHNGRLLHVEALKRGYDLDLFVVGSLLKMYGKCGSISEAEQVFKGLSEYDPVLWTGILSAYAENGKEQESLYLYRQMIEEGIDPDELAFMVVFQACSCLAEKGDSIKGIKVPSTIELSLEIGRGLHADIRKSGLDSNDFVGNSLISFYGKCGSIGEVNNVFVGLCHHDIMSWNALLLAYGEQGHAVKILQLYKQMQVEAVSANEQTFVVLLKACCMLAEQDADGILYSTECGPSESIVLSIGRALHSDACRKGFSSNVLINSMLLHLYGKCQSIHEADSVFGGLTHLDVVSYTAMLTAYVDQGEGEKALRLYRQMQEEGTSPDEQAFVAAFQACCTLFTKRQSSFAGLQAEDVVPLRIGQGVHVDALRKGITLNVYVRSSLLCMYSKCGGTLELEKIGCSLLCSSSVSWNAMISAYIDSLPVMKALQLYMHMQEEGIYPDEQTYLLVLQACCVLAEKEDDIVMWQENKMTCLEIGRALHVDASRKGLDASEFITSALVFMYGKCGSVAEAEALFDGLSRCNTVVWNSMLSAYVEHDQSLKALDLYEKMQLEGLSPDERTFVIVLQACGKFAERDAANAEDRRLSNLNFLEIGQKLHADAHKRGFDVDPFVGNALLSMYGKFGNIIEAENIFSTLTQLDSVSWNAMLSAYIGHAEGDEALKLYRQMREEGVLLNNVTFMCILQVCSESGRAEICRQLHFEIVSTMDNLSSSLATSLINAYGSCGCMAEAQATFNMVPRSGVVLWSALLSAYAQEGNSLASFRTYMEMQLRSIKPDKITFLSLLSAYSHTGLVHEGVECYESLCKDHGIAPDVKHFASLLDLLGRAGDVAKAEDLLSSTAFDSNLVMWLCLLRACGKHGNMELGKVAYEQAIRMQPEQAAAYVLMSNLYADTELWE